ncbi:unnamed protein product [Adineta steineri]|uniref:V-SNARE coiled-coil homology domain-containing protein n=1 Tax=Adineta steineri TaxID=433720 RepID=A0A814MXQ9_9BILA|nr:unnamed protein product [Adineta steineri]
MSDEEKYDALLMNIASQHTGGIHELLDTLFGFFARKTDLYTSPNVDQKPEELILQAFHKWEKVALAKHKKDKAERDEADRVRREKLRRKREEEEGEKDESSRIVSLPKNLLNFLYCLDVDYSWSAGLANPNYQSGSVRYTPSPRLQGLQNQVDEVTDVMRNNIGIALKRGEALDQLEQKAGYHILQASRRRMKRAIEVMFNMATGSTNSNHQSNGVRFTSPSGVQQLHGQVDEVMNVMKNNIALELERDGALHDIEHKSSILTEGARDLYLGSKELKKKYWWKNQRIWIILYIIVALVITIIIIATVAGGKK